jgi:ADP-ribose pyrophosphatase
MIENETPGNFHEVERSESSVGKQHSWGVYDIQYPNGNLVKNLFRVYDLVGGSAVLILDSEGYFYVNRQYRDTVADYVLEIPRGARKNEDLSFAACAEREALEETGLPPTELVELGIVRPDTGVIANEVHLYLALVAPFVPVPQVGESIRAVEKYTLPELQELVLRGEIADGYTLAALLRYMLLVR